MSLIWLVANSYRLLSRRVGSALAALVVLAVPMATVAAVVWGGRGAMNFVVVALLAALFLLWRPVLRDMANRPHTRAAGSIPERGPSAAGPGDVGESSAIREGS